MLVYFEGYYYPEIKVFKKLKIGDSDNYVVPVQRDKKGWYIEHIGYLFVSMEGGGEPVFVLPKNFLKKDTAHPEEGLTLLGMPGIKPEEIYDSDPDKNILAQRGQETFLPELSLWLFRAMSRYREERSKDKTPITEDELYYRSPDHGAYDRDFLSTAIHLIDFLSDHRNLFTQISKINNSGRSAVDWHKTIQQHPFIKDGKPYYLDLRIKDKAINIDEELIVLYYSVLRYLKEKFHFRINYGEINYPLKTRTEIQNYLDTGVGKRRMRDMKGKYFRDDLLELWSLLDAFFDCNISRDDKDPLKECLVTKQFHKVFERMVDALISNSDKLDRLKNQKDGKLVDHLFLYNSLFGPQHTIYYIGDSKYYPDDSHAEDVALYKQFTYARNAIQYNIDQYYIHHKKNPDAIRYRDKETEGYNVTPNFFISPKIESDNLDFTKHSFAATTWEHEPNRHFEDRLFDRDTLLLREYEINLVFLIAAYGAYEDCWTDSLHKTIREDMIDFLNENYVFFNIVPKPIPVYSEDRQVMEIPFLNYHHNRIRGKVYKVDEDSTNLILAFEKKTDIGTKDLADAQEHLSSSVEGKTLGDPVPLKP